MPAYTIDDTRAKRPLTCDVCTKPVDPTSLVRVCRRCGRVRHEACNVSPCAACGSEVQRPARFKGAKLVRYL
jgi:hypothetical protein